MTNISMLGNTTLSTLASTNPHEIALQSLCKQLLKSKLFKGYYLERRYVEELQDYRDVVCLQKSEKSLEKMLRDIRDKLQLFYSFQNPNMWIGITSGPLSGITQPLPFALETYLWVELKDMAFIEYWFNIKSIRFRANEVVIKLKVVQPVENEVIPTWALDSIRLKSIAHEKRASTDATTTKPDSTPTSQVTAEDFMLLLQQWWASTKQTVYSFMAEDITKQNLIGVLRFTLLLIVSTFSVLVMSLEVFGNFTLRLIFEISRLIHVLTPIIMQIIDVISKMIGGFYIILTMLWRDRPGNKNQPKYNAITYRKCEQRQR